MKQQTQSFSVQVTIQSAVESCQLFFSFSINLLF